MVLFKKIFVTFSKKIEINDIIVQKIKEEIDLLGENVIIFTRQKREDNLFKNKFLHYNFRIVQFKADWYQDSKNAGIIRDNKIFNISIDKVIVFTTENENNTEGIENIQFLSYINNIPLKIYIDNVLVFNDNKDYPITKEPENIELKTDAVKNFMKINSIEHNRQIMMSTKKYKKIYYDGLKSRPSIKIIEDTSDLSKNKANIKLTKSKIKKELMKKKDPKKKLKEELFMDL